MLVFPIEPSCALNHLVSMPDAWCSTSLLRAGPPGCACSDHPHPPHTHYRVASPLSLAFHSCFQMLGFICHRRWTREASGSWACWNDCPVRKASPERPFVHSLFVLLAVENWDVEESAFEQPQLALGSPHFLLGIHLRYYVRTSF